MAGNTATQGNPSAFDEIHASIFPADVRVNDRILARIRKRGPEHGEYIDVRVWRLSPLGVELVNPDCGQTFSRGEPVDLELVISGQRAGFEGLVVDLIRKTPQLTLMGIRFSRQTGQHEPWLERRRSARWLCSDEFLPTCVAPAPGRFDEYMYFQIRDISAEGLQLTCSLSNKFLVPGMQLRLTAVFPMGSVVAMTAEIVRIGVTSIGGSEKLSIGAEFRELQPMGRRAIGQYLIQFSDADTLEDLRAMGFEPESVAFGTKFYCLKSEADYQAVLELRYLANKGSGQVGEIDGPEGTGDVHDTRSRILVGKRRDRVIATARVRFPETEEPLELEEFVKWPSHMPRRDQIGEMSRVATHPDFRRSDLLAALFRFACMSCFDTERPWLVGYCMDKYKSFYRKLGFEILDISYDDPTWNGRINVMLVRTVDMIKGKGVHPAYWNEIWDGVPQMLANEGLIRLEGIDRARLGLYKALRPFTRAMVRLASLRGR